MYNKFNLTPPTSFYTTQDISRLYDQLMSDKQTFPTELSWLSEKVLANKDSRCIQEMWDVYLSVMSKIKVDIFGLDIPWKKDPAQAERTLHMLLNEHYYKKLYRLMLGARNLFDQIETFNYRQSFNELNDITYRYYFLTRRYLEKEIRHTNTEADQTEYLLQTENLFNKARNLVKKHSSHSETVTCPTNTDIFRFIQNYFAPLSYS